MSEQMTEQEAIDFFAVLFGGEHHLPDMPQKYGMGWAIRMVPGADFATFDPNMMTDAVFLAHDRCYRVAVSPSGKCLRLAIWKRAREGGFAHRHPTLADALARWRESFPEAQ